ncbi:MAG: Uma2 family endonuclease [Catenulispora sp.]|nr:Uma2 family endonuclease [Catenulispora sp.]
MTSDPGWTPELWEALRLVEAKLDGGLTIELWDSMPEDVRRGHEVSAGRLVVRQSGTPGHQRAVRRMANALEAAAGKAVVDGRYSCLATDAELDVILWDVPLTIREPDVAVYMCLPTGQRRVRAEVVLVVVEVVSPGSAADDTGRDDPRRGLVSKMTQYATAGIETYLTVFLRPDDSAIHRVQQWQLIAGSGEYRLVSERVNGIDDYALELRVPFDATLRFEQPAF